jgi:hypothetical protein
MYITVKEGNMPCCEGRVFVGADENQIASQSVGSKLYASKVMTIWRPSGLVIGQKM